MDTFDTITACVFLLGMLFPIARLTCWRQKGRLLSLRAALFPVLGWAIAVLDLSTWHHWNAPHRRAYQFILVCSAMAAACGKLALTVQAQRREADRKKQLLAQTKRSRSKA